MSIALLSIIGSIIHPGTAYWVCFGFYCLGWVLQLVGGIIKNVMDR